MRRLAALLLAGLAALVTTALVSAPGASAGTVTVHRGVVYANGQRLDAFVPAAPATAPRPAVVLVHGGGWRSGHRGWWSAQAHRLAARGWAAFSIDYRLAPAHRFPAALEDVHAAVQWVRAHAADYAVDPGRIALLGGSAGGHLALLAATTGAPVRGAAAWSPPTDLPALQGDVGTLVRGFLGCPPAACPARAREASPLAHLDAGDPPVFVVNATDEMIPLAQATGFAAAARAAGVAADLRIVPGKAHSSEYGTEVWPATAGFLARVLAAG